ncbi:MAG TPA: hypothetical protein VK504_27280 [Vicinamibacterales bacterium]|nr:hypothetical protein [Vicinamibacterales bacterium]
MDELNDEQTERDERKWVEGEQAAYRSMLSHCLQGLTTYDQNATPEVRATRLELLHSETIAALRAVCDEFGDNEWYDNLHPRDIIEKHLRRHLRAS